MLARLRLEYLHRLYGKAPKTILMEYILDVLKYESSSRCFKKLPTRSVTATTDAVSIDIMRMKRQL